MVDATASLWQPRKLMTKLLELLVGGLPLYESGSGLLSVLDDNSDQMDRGYNLLFAPRGRCRELRVKIRLSRGLAIWCANWIGR